MASLVLLLEALVTKRHHHCFLSVMREGSVVVDMDMEGRGLEGKVAEADEGLYDLQNNQLNSNSSKAMITAAIRTSIPKTLGFGSDKQQQIIQHCTVEGPCGAVYGRDERYIQSWRISECFP